jgi:Protein of unknown function (DUF4231)
MATGQGPPAVATMEDLKNQVLERYDKRIEYYWKSSLSNKRSYKATRYLLIFLGALVTLMSSISSASFLKGVGSTVFAIVTPVLAASLAIVGGVSQAFQWGAAWSDMVITATRLEKQRDRIAVTPANQLDPVKEMETLDDTVLAETQGFFQRLFGSGGPVKSEPTANGG